ncbi:MAG TPA: hypothetical protein VNZ26_11185 [Vicinamibacterales bacterium]|jgi:hypothetical protein|nr:hypothetical protein [Vicinamibacterales bacterium]
MPSSLTSTFLADILPDSAFLMYGTIAGPGSTPLGATRGGVKFSPDKKYRNALENVDGGRSKLYQGDRIISVDCKISCKLLQFGASTIQVVEPGIISSSGNGNVSIIYTPQPGSAFLTANAYLNNLRAIWLRTNGTFFQGRMPRALCTKYDAVSKDKDESEFDAEFEGRLDLTVVGNTTDSPIYFYEQLIAGLTVATL